MIDGGSLRSEAALDLLVCMGVISKIGERCEGVG